MKQLQIIDSYHQDTVHDISFNLYGTRLATCSSDRKVKIYNKVEGQWRLNGEFTAHDGPIWKVKWAHPDFGNILATCSYDKSVNIWEERKNNLVINPAMGNEQQSTWVSKTKLFDSKESVEDIKFAPKHMGLMLATASSEGQIRIYMAIDIMNLANWRLEQDFEASSWGINSISWNKNPFDPPMLCVASKDKNSYQFSENSQFQDSQEMNMTASKMNNNQSVPSNLNTLAQMQSQQTGRECSYLSIYYLKESKWVLLSSLPNKHYQQLFDSSEQMQGHSGAVFDVSWAQLNGRSYDLLASCGKDGIRIWHMKYEDNKLVIKKMEHLRDENDRLLQVWRVGWNLMATILAASDEKNQVKLWKNFGGKYQNVVTLKQDEIESLEA